MNASATVGVGTCLSTSKPLSIGLTPVPICLLRRRRRCLMIGAETEVELAASEAQPASRRLILLRHAKSSWQHPSLRDHDRPLSKTGRVDAVTVSRKLQLMPCGPGKHLISCRKRRVVSWKRRCMGHNRGWEEAASMFTGASVELKTCNAALLEAPGKSWEEAFAVAGYGGWKLQGIVTPSSNL